MNKGNKFIAMILAALLSVGSMSIIGVSAKSFDDVTEESGYAEQIDILSDIGVILGTSEKEFSPEDDVTREQMALLLFRLMLNKNDGGKVNTSDFTDLYDETYHGAISWAAAAGYILGTSSSTFEPLGGISMQDAMTMLVRALGQSSEQMNSGYPWTYIDAAIKLGLDKGLEKVAYTDTLTRAETAAILYNALTAEYLVPKTLSNGVTIYEATTIIEQVFGYEMDTAKITATNDYTLTGTSVVKSGYVILTYIDDKGNEKSMAVKFSELGLEGEANDWLGHSFKVIYSVNKNTKLVSVLSAIEVSDSKHYDEVKFDSDKKYVEIGGTKFAVVEEYSDILATNNNELLVYIYGDDGKLEQIKTTKALSETLGIYDLELIFEGESDTAARAIVKGYQVGKLEIDKNDKINLAGNKTEKELTGGFLNEVDAEDGDYVLYYYNSHLKRLEIAQVLDITTGIVTRLTATTARVDGETYTLGNANAGVSPDAIRAQLTVGREAKLVMYKDTIVGIVDGITATAASEYLLALSDAVPVYSDGSFRYIVTAHVNGVTKNIFVSSSNIKAGNVYRYIETSETYTLISPEIIENRILSGPGRFVQNDAKIKEIAALIDSAAGNNITFNGNTYYTLSATEEEVTTSEATWNDVRFVTDKNSLIVVNGENGLQFVKGAYASTITVNEGAKITAVFKNEAGSVETLKFLYITDAKLGNYDSASQFVKVISYSGLIYEDGKTYSEYNVFNFATGAVEVKKSALSNLESGKVYRTGTDGLIINVEYTESINGFVSGYTSSTITVNGTIYKLASDAKIITVDGNLNATEKTIADTYMNHVQFVSESGTVKAVLLSGAPTFQAVQSGNKLVISTNLTLSEFDANSLSIEALKINDKNVDKDIVTISINAENNTIEITSENTLAEGIYEIGFRFGGKAFSVTGIVTAPTVDPDTANA